MCLFVNTHMTTGNIYLSPSFLSRLGVIEEEREEDERKLNVAVAAVERMNVLVSYMGFTSVYFLDVLHEFRLVHSTYNMAELTLALCV